MVPVDTIHIVTITIFELHHNIQKQRLVDPVPQPEEGKTEVGHYVEGAGEGGGGGERLGDDV